MTGAGPPRACGYCGEAFCYCHPDPDQQARVEQLDQTVSNLKDGIQQSAAVHHEVQRQLEQENATLKARIERMVADNLLHASGKCYCHGEGTCNYCQLIEERERAEALRATVAELEEGLRKTMSERDLEKSRCVLLRAVVDLQTERWTKLREWVSINIALPLPIPNCVGYSGETHSTRPYERMKEEMDRLERDAPGGE